MKDNFQNIAKIIEVYESAMVETTKKMISIKAIAPVSGGTGEGERAAFLNSLLKEWGFDTKVYEYVDTFCVRRPSIMTKIGDAQRTIWFVAHIDTVSEGDPKLWETDPFTAVVKDGKIYGRGTNDDGQAVISTIYAMKALKESGAKLKYNYGLVLAADEEVGSHYGMLKLVEDNLFAKDDIFVVPDFGSENGDVIEIGEKGLLWLRITVTGKQVHASTPDKGVNASRYAMRFLNYVDNMLHQKYTASNRLYNPPTSTFEPTKREKNVDSTNIIPGTDVSYIDCRVLPQYKLDDVIADIKQVAIRFSEVKIDIETFNRDDPAPETKEDSEVVKMLEAALKDLRGIDAKKLGTGGGTCAAAVRKVGMQAVAWMTMDKVAHQPNEYLRIKDMIEDAKVFAYLPL